MVGTPDRGSGLVGAPDEGAAGVDFVCILIQIVGKVVALDASTGDLQRLVLAARRRGGAVLAERLGVFADHSHDPVDGLGRWVSAQLGKACLRVFVARRLLALFKQLLGVFGLEVPVDGVAALLVVVLVNQRADLLKRSDAGDRGVGNIGGGLLSSDKAVVSADQNLRGLDFAWDGSVNSRGLVALGSLELLDKGRNIVGDWLLRCDVSLVGGE